MVDDWRKQWAENYAKNRAQGFERQAHLVRWFRENGHGDEADCFIAEMRELKSKHEERMLKIEADHAEKMRANHRKFRMEMLRVWGIGLTVVLVGAAVLIVLSVVM